MKYLVTAAMALALTGAAASAFADPPPDHHDHSGGHPAPAHGAPPPGGAGHAGGPGAHAGTPGGGHGGPPGGVVHAIGGTPGGHGGVLGVGLHLALPTPGGGGAHPGGGGHGFGFHSHALRPGDQGRSYYNSGAFQRQYNAQRRFRVFNYNYPGGWYARSWVYGDFLPFGWFTPDYYLDWGYYQLPEPPIGCEWVREGPDAVLVDVWTGEVLSVYSGAFY
jgi:hypothetical protein